MKGATTVLSAATLVARLPTQLNLLLVKIYLNSSLYIVATFCVSFTADPPRITTHPQELKDVVPGKPATFSVEATGTEPLTYKWEWNPAGERHGTEEWQLCDLESFPGGDSSTVTIPSVQKSNEGSYRCVVSNCAGSQISKLAQLSVGKNIFHDLCVTCL